MIIAVASVFVGCSFNCTESVDVCPIPVVPSKYVMDKFAGMRNDEKMTKFWMDEYRLHRQLNICNEAK